MLHSSIVLTNNSNIQGRGLIATSVIHVGEIVWQLDPGEKPVSRAEMRKWTEEKKRDFDHFAFQCGENEYILPVGTDKYMNHSCDPNTWWGNTFSLIARRDIQRGEEVTYDYSTADISTEYKLECHCGSADCRGFVTNNDYQDASWQLKYLTNLPDHVLRAIEKNKR